MGVYQMGLKNLVGGSQQPYRVQSWFVFVSCFIAGSSLPCSALSRSVMFHVPAIINDSKRIPPIISQWLQGSGRTKAYQLAPTITSTYHQLPASTKEHQGVPTNTKEYQRMLTSTTSNFHRLQPRTHMVCNNNTGETHNGSQMRERA